LPAYPTSSQLLRCGKNFLLAYNPYAALQNFYRALHLGELWVFKTATVKPP
jgi:hypothetical protein